MKRYICFFVALLLALAPVIYLSRDGLSDDIVLTFETSASDNTEKISSWRSNSGDYYVFLPAYADMKSIVLTGDAGQGADLCINGISAGTGTVPEAFEPGRAYPLSYRAWGRQVQTCITFVEAGTLPTMHIDTLSGDMDFVHEEKRNREDALVRLYSPEGEVLFADEGARINGRGNSTWQQYDKKPYSLRLSQEASLLGMGAAQKWILLANASDPSHVRNKLAYELAAEVGLDHSPDSEWVNVYLNGEYAGLYQLSERNEIHPERVNITGNAPVLFSMESAARMDSRNYTYVTTRENQALRIHYPELLSAEETEALITKIQAAEDAIISGSDELFTLIDKDSWVRKYLVEEVLGNVDGGYISQYFYFDESGDGKIHAGPVWDYDFAMGSDAVWQTGFTDGFFANRLVVREGVEAPWFHSLYKNREFYDEVLRVYGEIFVPHLERMLETELEKYMAEIRAEAAADGIRTEKKGCSFEESVRRVKDYIKERIAFLDDVWFGDTVYHTVCFNDDVDTNYAYTMVEDGGRVSHLPKTYEIENRTFAGWYRADTEEPFNPEEPVYESIDVYARWNKSSAPVFGKLLKAGPIGLIALLGLVLLIIDLKRSKESR